ncbi:hypothetical protein CH063_15339 [Colletotrichum higginsianum]|uniref:Uncharacterized protein n=1 Tax=Colletotrichum higginsianum (strain IMI 349063) TaxID=759273 RepID=H1W2E6_COLHI|nr:hypothetical protein CH063_15339 [Colletotrichum higginsianum]
MPRTNALDRSATKGVRSPRHCLTGPNDQHWGSVCYCKGDERQAAGYDREGESYRMVVAEQASQTWPYRLREEVSGALMDVSQCVRCECIIIRIGADLLLRQPSNDNSKRLEAEWKAVRSSTGVAMRWDDDLADESCSGLGAILRFIERVERSPHGPVNVPAEDAVSFQDVDDFVCIGHFPPGTALRQAFEAVADKYRTEFTFGVVVVDVDSPGVAVAAAANDAKVVCHKRDDQSVHTWTSGDDGLEAWLVEASRPVIAELTPANHQRFLDVSRSPSPLPETRD